jgi:transcriptional regulator with XRE-family HTH domain
MIGTELRDARLSAGTSQDRLGAASGISGSEIGRIEHGASRRLSIDVAATVAAVLGLELSVRLYPRGDRVRDAASMALLHRLRDRMGAAWRWQYEVPLGPDDLRAWDAVVTSARGDRRLAIEAETRLRDIQALLRRLALKRAADPRVDRAVLLVADTRNNRLVMVGAAPMLQAGFPMKTRHALAPLARGKLRTRSPRRGLNSRRRTVTAELIDIEQP